MTGWTKMALGMEVGLGPGDFVFNGDPDSDFVFDGAQLPPEHTHHHPVFGPCLFWPNGWMDEDATWYGSRSRPRPHCIRRGPTSARNGHRAPPSFRPMFIVATVAHLSYCWAVVAQLMAWVSSGMPGHVQSFLLKIAHWLGAIWNIWHFSDYWHFLVPPVQVRVCCVFVFKEFVFTFRGWWKVWAMCPRVRPSLVLVTATRGRRWNSTWTELTTWSFRPSAFSISSTRMSTLSQCASGVSLCFEDERFWWIYSIHCVHEKTAP